MPDDLEYQLAKAILAATATAALDWKPLNGDSDYTFVAKMKAGQAIAYKGPNEYQLKVTDANQNVIEHIQPELEDELHRTIREIWVLARRQALGTTEAVWKFVEEARSLTTQSLRNL